jgi:hypothetical protein
MHNDTPLGTAMHLEELDRQAAAKSRSLRPNQSGWRPAARSLTVVAHLRHPLGVGGRWRDKASRVVGA